MSMLRPVRLAMLLILTGLVLLSLPGQVLAQADKPEVNEKHLELWDDFNYYVRIARPEMAQTSWESLSRQVNDSQLLDIVEASKSYRNNWQATITRARGMDALEDVAEQVAKRVESALLARSRNADRIATAIDQLDDGSRPNFNARKMLKEAGQFAVPQMLEAIKDRDLAALHPYLMQAFQDVGRDAVYPLSVALPELETLPQGTVAQILAELGYPSALPYLKKVIEAEDTAVDARARAQVAYDLLAKQVRLGDEVSAAQLFLMAGQQHYRFGTQDKRLLGYDEELDRGIVWQYDRNVGLIPLPVPSEIHADVRAMEAARHALILDASLDQALALHLMANVRREQRLPEGEKDESYRLARNAHFYLKMAGAERQEDVLEQGLIDGDIELARAALAALAETGGIEVLLGTAEGNRPVIKSLMHPNRRLRIEAAFAFSNARPQESFAGDRRVVPVLAEAVRQGGKPNAIVLAADADRLNELAGAVDQAGLNVLRGNRFADVLSKVEDLSGVDVVIVDGPVSNVAAAFDVTISDYRLAAVPVIGMLGSVDAAEIRKLYLDNNRLLTAGSMEDLGKRLNDALAMDATGKLEGAEAEAYALRALGILHDMAANGATVFNVKEAQATLIQTILLDDREEVVKAAAGVLALLPDAEAQQAIASAAVAGERKARSSIGLQAALLNSLADSANYHSVQLTDMQLKKALDVLRNNSDRRASNELAQAASRAAGALLRPTEELVDQIVK